MYLSGFEQLISNKNLPKSLLLYGVCDYQISQYSSIALNLHNDMNDEPFVIYFDAYDFNTAKTFLAQSSLFGGKNILVIKTDKNISNKELDILIQICNQGEDNYFILEYYGDDKNSKGMSKSFKPTLRADFVRFFHTNVNEAIKLMRRKANQLDINISDFVLNKLYFAQNENLALAISEFNKLSISNSKEISQEQIEKLVFGLGSISMENFINKLLNLNDIRKDFQVIVEEKSYEEIQLILALQNKINQLFLLHAHIKIYGQFNAKEVLGYSPPAQIANELQKHCIKISTLKFQKLLILLANSELKLKTNIRTEKTAFLLSVLIRLQSIIKDK